MAGDRFGGSPKTDNLVSQLQHVNLSEYKKIENAWENVIKEGKRVSVNVDVLYSGANLRPIGFEVSYTIDGKAFNVSILN